MVGHVKEGYEGYNSTPSSPNKYIVNRNNQNHVENTNGQHSISTKCIALIAAVVLVLLIAAPLTVYFAAKCDKYESHEQAAFTNGNSNKAIANGHNGTHVKKAGSILPIRHDDEDDDDDGDDYASFGTTAGTFQFNEIADDIEYDHILKSNNFRLPRMLAPLHYEIKIIPFINNLTTIGEVNIKIHCKEMTNTVMMNLKNIEIKNDIVVTLDNTDEIVPIDHINFNEKVELMIIYLKRQLPAGQIFNVYIRYTGSIKKMPNGLYISYFDNKNTADSSMVSTLMSPTYARSIFPSFDEPSFKASFKFIIGRQLNMFSLSNMHINETQPMENNPYWLWDYYQDTPIMSTYLTAFLVAPVVSLKGYNLANSTNPKIALWTRPAYSYQTDIGQRLADDLVKYFTRYFSIEFPLSKIDIVAVPAMDYMAMENWGLIIFEENKILADKGNSVNTKQSLALMLAHEIAHQWFGNLVTPVWWDDLWLKEGFSSYFQYLAIDDLYPDWEVFNKFTLVEMENAFSTDSMLISHPISLTVEKADKKIFDGLSYHKGSSVIRMMAHFLGQEKLKEHLRYFLVNYSYRNAKQQDLWDSLSSEEYVHDIDKVIKLNTFMETWTRQPGYPVVTITRNYTSNTAVIRQERFLLNGQIDKNSLLWWIPISYTSRLEKEFLNTHPKYWLPGEESMSISKLPDKDGWILLNLQCTGFYRVNYDNANWILLINDYHNLATTVKSQLIKDSFNLARAGKLNYDIPLSLAAQLSTETEYLPWQAAAQVFEYLKNSIFKMPAYEYFQLYVLVLIRQVYSSLVQEMSQSNRIPWIVADSPIAQQHAENIINLACTFQESHCVSTSKVMYHNWMSSPENGNEIPVAIRSIVYCTAIREGGRDEWEFAYGRLMDKSLEDNFEKANLLKALGCSSKPWLSTKALSHLNLHSGLDKNDGMILFKSVVSNNVGHWIAYSFVHSEWERMLEYYGSQHAVYEMVCSLVDYINSPIELEQLNALAIKIINKTEEKNDYLMGCLERAANNKFWMENNYRNFTTWLDDFVFSYKLI